MKQRTWRKSMTVAVIVSLLIGVATVGLGLWDLHKINKINGQIASVDFSVPATSITSPTTGQTISGVIILDARALGNEVTRRAICRDGWFLAQRLNRERRFVYWWLGRELEQRKPTQRHLPNLEYRLQRERAK